VFTNIVLFVPKTYELATSPATVFETPATIEFCVKLDVEFPTPMFKLYFPAAPPEPIPLGLVVPNNILLPPILAEGLPFPEVSVFTQRPLFNRIPLLLK